MDEINPIKRLQIVVELLQEDLELFKLDDKINTQVRKSVERTHREFYLQEKMKAIQKELGRGDEQGDIDELREQIEAAGMTEEAQEKALKELDRLQQMPPMSAESGNVIRTYIDWPHRFALGQTDGERNRPRGSGENTRGGPLWTRKAQRTHP